MRRRALLGLAVIAWLVVFALPGANAQVSAGGPNAVTDWNKFAIDTLVLFPPAASGAPSSLQVNLGMVQGAVYDAVNAITPKHHRPYLLNRRFSARASGEAAVATAASRVLSNIISTVPAGITFGNRDTLLQSVATKYAAALAAIPDSPFKRQGIDAGNAAADAMIEARQDDGRFGPSQWDQSTGPGRWQPLLPNGTSPLDPTPWLGGVKPFLLQSSSQFRTAGPNDLKSAAYAADFNEVKMLGGDGLPLPGGTPTTRTATQTHNALFWQSGGGPAFLWSGTARNLIEDPAYDLDLADSARLLAMMNLSAADAVINCWNDKYHFDFWRPWTAIRQAGADDNPDTVADPNWAPLLTAPYPDHTSGHMCLDGAHLHTLQLFFGKDNVPISVTSTQFGGETRSFPSFSAPLDEIVQARIWAGLHFRTADVQGRDLGINVANYRADNYFQKVGRS
jgi:hypothetical protein